MSDVIACTECLSVLEDHLSSLLYKTDLTCEVMCDVCFSIVRYRFVNHLHDDFIVKVLQHTPNKVHVEDVAAFKLGGSIALNQLRVARNE